jgi:hypothetical protein
VVAVYYDGATHPAVLGRRHVPLRPVTELAQIAEVRVGADGFTTPAE